MYNCRALNFSTIALDLTKLTHKSSFGMNHVELYFKKP